MKARLSEHSPHSLSLESRGYFCLLMPQREYSRCRVVSDICYVSHNLHSVKKKSQQTELEKLVISLSQGYHIQLSVLESCHTSTATFTLLPVAYCFASFSVPLLGLNGEGWAAEAAINRSHRQREGMKEDYDIATICSRPPETSYTKMLCQGTSASTHQPVELQSTIRDREKKITHHHWHNYAIKNLSVGTYGLLFVS